LAFTGGIGEHDAVLRREVTQALSYLGIEIDDAINQVACADQIKAIHTASSKVQVWVIPTDEGRVAAQEALSLL
jgi:acetate kinase